MSCRIVELQKDIAENYYGELVKMINLHDYVINGTNIDNISDVGKIDKLLDECADFIKNNSIEINNVFTNGDLMPVA